MFSKMSSRIGKKAMAGLVVATIGLGLVTGGGAAHAERNDSGGVWTDCYYDGLVYSDGSVIKDANGVIFRCSSGTWTRARVVNPGGTKFDIVSNAGVLQAAP